jgi:hypothetical protein
VSVNTTLASAFFKDYLGKTFNTEEMRKAEVWKKLSERFAGLKQEGRRATPGPRHARVCFRVVGVGGKRSALKKVLF